MYEKLMKQGKVLMDFQEVGEYEAIVLCEWNDEYVVWTANLYTGDTYWGHYFKTLDEAVDYFQLATLKI